MTATRQALADGDIPAALPGLDAIHAAAARARRVLKAPAHGHHARPRSRSAPPGQLRDLVRQHLATHPGAEFSPHQIGRVLGRSSGAVANALDRLVNLGHAQLTCERPRRFTATSVRSK